MRESIAKGVVREMIYRECFLRWLDDEQRARGNILVLLGNEMSEIPFLVECGFDLHHVHSVERDSVVYEAQRELLRKGTLPVCVYRGEMNDYLRTMLHLEDRFVAMNLDVEGSYRTQLDPSMDCVIRFCLANPQTVIAMHSTIGRRDMYNIYAGIRALYVLRALVPDVQTDFMFCSLVERYARCGSTVPERFALRDVFWLVSQIEHIVCLSVNVGMMSSDDAFFVFRTSEAVWNTYRRVRRNRLVMYTIRQDVAAYSACRTDSPLIDHVRVPVRLERLRHVYYNAQRPWSQRCYIVRYGTSLCDGYLLSDVVRDLCSLMIDQPLTYIKRDGTRADYAFIPDTLRDHTLLTGRQYMREYSDIFSPRRLTFLRSNGKEVHDGHVSF